MTKWNPRLSQASKSYSIVTLALILSSSAVAQTEETEVRPAGTMFTSESQDLVGRELPTVSLETPSTPPNTAICRATCDAFTPRQPVLALEWQSTGTEPGIAPGRDPAKPFRLDISGTVTGFTQGNFSTIDLSRVPQVDAVVLDPPSPMPLATSELLLYKVQDNQIIARDPDLPIFLSSDILQNRLPQLTLADRSAVEDDLKTGGLAQVRVLGRAVTPLQGAPHQIVTMVGLQPGGTYRLRVVDEEGGGVQALVQQICRIPVCPADFIQPD